MTPLKEWLLKLEDVELYRARDKLENDLNAVNGEIRLRSNRDLINSALEKEGKT